MYLPPLRESGRIEKVGPTYSDVRIMFDIWVPDKAYVDDLGHAPENFPVPTEAPWDTITIHPLSNYFRACSSASRLVVSYQLLRYFSCVKSIYPTASWRQLLVTRPAIFCIRFSIDAYRCDDSVDQIYHGIPRVEVDVFGKYGVTFGDVDTLWQTALPRNIGLVPDDGLCTGKLNIYG
jgi:hypothetical protein